ncbi:MULTISPECIES: hypothetical protein [unclassified Marinovum]|uniref:hypothetical protein n=1 Tax=unclassified Marinovum TaxID=2647166 RepID=UPI003EDC31A5
MTKCNATPGEIERLLHHMKTVGAAPTPSWGRDFARSITKQAHRRNWRPTAKQFGVMNRLVDELFNRTDQEEGDLDVIED